MILLCLWIVVALVVIAACCNRLDCIDDVAVALDGAVVSGVTNASTEWFWCPHNITVATAASSAKIEPVSFETASVLPLIIWYSLCCVRRYDLICKATSSSVKSVAMGVPTQKNGEERGRWCASESKYVLSKGWRFEHNILRSLGVMWLHLLPQCRLTLSTLIIG